MSIKRLVEQNVWNESTQQWEKGYTPTDARIVETADGSNVQAKLDALPGQLTDAQAAAVAEIRADVAAEGDTLAKLYGLIAGLQTLTQSDTATLDTLQEVVDFVKNNRVDIDAIGTNKVNITDIVNTLTTVGTMQELSCIIGHLFVELEPPCQVCEDKEQITICGTTYTGQKAVLVIGADGFYFDGNPEEISKIRKGRCMNGAGQK